jgi:hypothetical protein
LLCVIFRWHYYPSVILLFLLYFCLLYYFLSRLHSFCNNFTFLFLFNWLIVCQGFFILFFLSFLNWFFVFGLLDDRLHFFIIICLISFGLIIVIVFLMIISFWDLLSFLDLFNLFCFLCYYFLYFLLFNWLLNFWFFFNFWLSLNLLFFFFWFSVLVVLFKLSMLFVLIFILIILVLVIFVMILIGVSELSWCVSNSSPVFDQLFVLSAHFNKKSSIKYFFVIRSLYEVDGIDSHF